MLWERPLGLTLVMALVSVIMLSVWREREDLLLFALCAVAGALAEAAAIAFGAWTYGFPNMIGIPLWLPLLWGVAGLFIKRMGEELHSFVRKH